ncbi:aldo/keto reductase [Halolamina salifodinae]|uniref:Aryl-alcohol dehydrogenase-like predicted oxidoreductase n=1 Tax=Halolamina salifodinae TaxID=1202767 RepID=A0A8T4GWV3_9EURY|nr:aldo/keto reductase [Halolamina salifodinae]MBP1987601.1 aryl-alcohol dehydrogenase-like predicted oxidoreductase [Halolamina salifodinae]
MTTNQSDTFDIGEYTVHRLGFGAMRLCGENIIGAPDDEAASREVAREAVDLGVDFIDTADSYGPGTSERLLREAGVVGTGATGDGRPDADDALVATKGGLLRSPDGDWLPNGDPDYLKNAALASLDRLGVDSIDLYQFHRPDPDTDFAASVAALGELKDDGLIENVGVSNVSVEQLETARDHVEVATVQNEYNLTNREHQDVLDACEDAGIGFIPYFPIGAGDLDEKAEVVDDVAEAHDASRYQIALAWLLGSSDVTLPIPGTSSVEHLRENVAASEIDLREGEIARLSE